VRGRSIGLVLLAPALARPVVLGPEGRADPIARIRSMDLADAAEAVEGLPEPSRTRERAAVLYRASDPAGAKEAALRSLERDADDVEILSLVGDLEARRGALDAAQARYREARDALDRDPRVVASGRKGDWERWLEGRERYLLEERAYGARLERARGRSSWACAGTIVASLGLFAACVALALRRAPDEGIPETL
jgi:hypothetical protein